MSQEDHNLPQRIISATKALISETEDISTITVRRIAQRAGVGLGLINYHFHSRDNLLSVAIGESMVRIISDFTSTKANHDQPPVCQLKELLTKLCSMAGSDTKFVRFIIQRELYEGSAQAPLHLTPLLKAIYGAEKDEMQLRIIAMQIIHPLQVACLDTDAFHMFSGINLLNPDERATFIDSLVNNLIPPADKEGKS